MGEKGNIAADFEPTTSSRAPQFGFPAAPSGYPEDSVGKGPTDAFGKGPADDFGKGPEEGFGKGPSGPPGVGASQGGDWQKFPGGTGPAAHPGPPVVPPQGGPWDPPTYPAGGTPSGSPALPPVAGFYRRTGDPDDQRPEPPHAPPYR